MSTKTDFSACQHFHPIRFSSSCFFCFFLSSSPYFQSINWSSILVSLAKSPPRPSKSQTTASLLQPTKTACSAGCPLDKRCLCKNLIKRHSRKDKLQKLFKCLFLETSLTPGLRTYEKAAVYGRPKPDAVCRVRMLQPLQLCCFPYPTSQFLSTSNTQPFQSFQLVSLLMSFGT